MKKAILFSFFIFFSFFAGQITSSALTIKAQTPPEQSGDFAACVGAALAKYFQDVLVGTRGLDKIKILSPAFNLTNPIEFDMFYVMKSGPNGEFFKPQNYGNFFGFAGNTYSIGGVKAYDWFASPEITGRNWKGETVGAYAGTQMIFTEFGDFDTFGDGAGLGVPGSARGTIIGNLATEYGRSSNDGSIAAINFFAAMQSYSNPEFRGHNLTNSEIGQVVGAGSAAKAGQNPGLFVAGESLPQAVQSNGLPNGWVLDIVGGPGDLDSATRFVNTAHSLGYNPILRTCVGNKCGFAEPSIYVSFLRSLNAVITGPVWVIAGPNEPATEHWAAPACAPEGKKFELDEVPCNATQEPEFHSLRPYPTNPCNKQVEQAYYMCGQDLVVKDTYEFQDGGGQCEDLPGGGRRCRYTIEGQTSQVSLGLLNANLPILGNTEGVPNSTNSELPEESRSTIDFKQRVNEYVSWYLNGIPYRAEEKTDSIQNQVIGEMNIYDKIINLAGPLKKLLPRPIQTAERSNEKDRIGIEGEIGRHNQIAECGTPNAPEQCYTDSNQYQRITNLVQAGPNTRGFPYLPFSSTEDRLGLATSGLRFGAPSCADGNPNADDIESGITCIDYESENTSKELYFAHVDESNELGRMLQNTYKPFSVNDAGTAPKEGLAELIDTPYCELIEARTNPGDKLYGELVRPGDTETKPISGTLTYSANFTCDFPSPDPEQVALCMTGCEDLPADAQAQCELDCNNTSNTCLREVFVPFSVTVTSPGFENIWERFVAGSMSIVKRIFPLVGPNAPIVKLEDIPGKSGATYRSQVISGNPELLTSEALAGDPNKNRPGVTAEIYFPHLGSVYDYFLKGIQTALRPYGIKEEDTGQVIPPAVCTIENANFRSQALLNIISQAAKWARIPVELLTMVVEKEGCGYFGSPNGICGLSDGEVEQYSAPGAQYPRNCVQGISRASGPMQIINGIFNNWSTAVNQGTGDTRTPNNCNIKDSIFAAAWILSAGYPPNLLTPQPGYNVVNSPEPGSWTMTDMQRAISKWVNGYLDNTSQICETRPALLPAAACFTESYCAQLLRHNNTIKTDCNAKPSGSGVDIPSC